MMKHWFRLACAGAALAGLLSVSAFAAEYTGCAAKLDALGLFRGTEQGYELDRAPTRAEAAVMLVRLLGGEQAAQGLAYTAPFADLSGWEKPYVQYLYDRGLTNGASPSAFQPDEPCSAQMYAAFLLRALGYSEAAGDFSYAEASSMAQDCGIYDPTVIDTADFRRDDAAAASYTALSATPAEGEGTLLDRLVRQGAVDPAAAQPYQTLFTAYAQYRAAAAGMEELTAFTVENTVSPAADFRRSDAEDGVLLSLRTQETMSFDRLAGTMTANRVITLSAPGVEGTTVTADSALADGVLCRRLDTGRTEQPLDARGQARLLSCYGPAPLAWVGDIAEAGADGRWTLTLDGMPGLYRELLWPVESALGSLEEAQFRTVNLVQEMQGGRITVQELSAAFTLDGLYGQPVLTSRLTRADG